MERQEMQARLNEGTVGGDVLVLWWTIASPSANRLLWTVVMMAGNA